MSKRCPSCGYAPIGPFTDNCPICAEPVRNVRSSGFGRGSGSGWFSGLSAPVKGILLGLGICVLFVAGCCGMGMWNFGNAMKDAQKQMELMQAQAEAERQARTIRVSASELLKDFETDPAAADRKYLGQYLELTGVVERVGQGRFERLFVVVHGGDEKSKLKIECFFEVIEPIQEIAVKRLNAGDAVIIRGEFDGRVSNVQMRECSLEPKIGGK